MSINFIGPRYFLAPRRVISSSRSFMDCSLARCWARRSAAVIRGMISSKGLSTIRMERILGGLRDVIRLDMRRVEQIHTILGVHPCQFLANLLETIGLHNEGQDEPESPIFAASGINL